MIKYNLDIAEYHNNKAMSNSKLKLLAVSPANYQYYIKNPQHKNAFDIGSTVHLMVLEPHKVLNKVAVYPDVDLRTKQGKIDYASFMDNNQGKIILSEEQYNDCLAMALVVKHSPHKSYFKDGLAEVSLFAEIDGVAVRARPDFITDSGFIVDLKTTQNASQEAFERDFYKLKYYMQAAFYMDIYETCFNKPAKGFVFVTVQNTAPFLTGKAITMHPNNAYLQHGKEEYKKLLKLYKECEKTNNWYGNFESDINSTYEISMPIWLEKQIYNQQIYGK